MRHYMQSIAGVFGLVVVWWLTTDGLRLVDATTLASPVAVAMSIVDLAVDSFAGDTLLGHSLASLTRWFAGVFLGCAIGVPLGVLMAWNRRVNAFVSPIFEVFRYIPPFAWVPLAILWFGTSLTSQAAVVAIAAIPPALLNAHKAISQLDSTMLSASAVLGASDARTLMKVAVPTAAPGVLAGVRLAFSNGWMALVGAELVGARSGLGYVISRAQANLSTEVVIAGMVTIAVIGVIVDIVLRKATDRLLGWTTTSQEQR
ncbi:ABC transporter permease [Microbacterium alcoholitolerans]|uniref:ABC transporter permease n=1 Tax=unclassified Microbacterium TaxID=2609290 RepID=UPI003D1762E7